MTRLKSYWTDGLSGLRGLSQNPNFCIYNTQYVYYKNFLYKKTQKGADHVDHVDHMLKCSLI